jgi:hypothetical protein
MLRTSCPECRACSLTSDQHSGALDLFSALVRANTTINEKEPHMTTVQPDSENIRKAAKWVIEERKYNPNQSLGKLIEEAGSKFDLSPLETDFLERFIRDEKV